MKILFIIQARMTSSRLPKKVMLPLCNKSVLEIMLQRLSNFKESIIIATTNDSTQEPIVKLCTQLGVKYYQGDTENVLSRYYESALQFGATDNDIVVRCTSDCPIIDQDITHKTIEYFQQNDFDYVKAGSQSGFPRGLDTEVFRFKLLKEAYFNATTEWEKEHVTPYIYLTKKDTFKIGSYTNHKDHSKYRLTLDEEDDYFAIKELYKLFDCRTDFDYDALISMLEEHPYIYDINAHVEQKKITT